MESNGGAPFAACRGFPVAIPSRVPPTNYSLKEENAMNKLWTMLAGIGVGAAIMYTLDPQTGRRRRAVARDKITSALNKTGDAFGTFSSDVANRARGVYSETTSKVTREPVTDNVLAERVRSRIGRFSSHPGSIEVTVSGGRLTLRGPILKEEVNDVLRSTRDVRGVVDVNDQLEVHDDSTGIPGLQGPGKRPGAAWGFARYNWSPTHRVFATGIGSGLAVWGLTRRRNPAAMLASLAGLAFAVRGATNQELNRIVRFGGGRKPQEATTQGETAATGTTAGTTTTGSTTTGTTTTGTSTGTTSETTTGVGTGRTTTKRSRK